MEAVDTLSDSESVQSRDSVSYIHTFSFIELLNRGRHSALWKWRPSAP